MKKTNPAQVIFLCLAVVLHLVGIAFLLTASGIFTIDLVNQYLFMNGSMNVVLKYVIVIATMAVSILMFTITAGTMSGKKSIVLTNICTTWSVIITLPLVYVFVVLLIDALMKNGATLPLWDILVGDVAGDKGFSAFLTTDILKYVIYGLGIIMSILFIIVPVLSARVNNKKKRDEMAVKKQDKEIPEVEEVQPQAAEVSEEEVKEEDPQTVEIKEETKSEEEKEEIVEEDAPQTEEVNNENIKEDSQVEIKEEVKEEPQVEIKEEVKEDPQAEIEEEVKEEPQADEVSKEEKVPQVEEEKEAPVIEEIKIVKKETKAKKTVAKKVEKETEVKEIKKTNKALGKIEYDLRIDGYHFYVLASNNQLMFDSQGFASLDTVMSGFETFKNALAKDVASVYEDKNGAFRFIINKRYVGEGYKTRAQAEKAIQSVKNFALNGVVQEYVEDSEEKKAYEEAKKAMKKGTGVNWDEALAIPEKTLGKFTINYIEDRGYYFALLANNGQILFTSRFYASADSCEDAIITFKKAAYLGNFFIDSDKFGNFRFILKGTNTVYVGESYKSKDSAVSSSESVQKFAKSAKIIPYTAAEEE